MIRHSCVKSCGPWPFKVSITSRISKALPMAWPRGRSISVRTALTERPFSLPISTIAFARARASSKVFIKAPLPTLTSRRIASAPEANFLLITDDAMRGILSTVPVTSRKAYNFLSAGASPSDWPITARPILLTWAIKSSCSKDTFKLGMDSILSIVPPVCPKPRPDILATLPPQAATRGPMISVVLSPTPPVLCLSTVIPSILDKSTMWPDWAIAKVNVPNSRALMPLNTMVINRALTW